VDGTRPAPPGRPWSEIAIAPLEPIDGDLLDAVLRALSGHVELPCRPVASPLVPPFDAVAGRPQLDADRLLLRLEATGGRTPLVGLVAADFGVPILSFVFGRARLGGNAAVASLARLRPEFYGEVADAELVGRRAAAEILHELGHLAGLPHCPDAACLMAFAGDVETADQRGLAFCDLCAASLPHGLAPARRELLLDF
jgi:archaemetzincin